MKRPCPGPREQSSVINTDALGASSPVSAAKGSSRLVKDCWGFTECTQKLPGRKHWEVKFSSSHCINKAAVAIVPGLRDQTTNSRQGTHIKRRGLLLDAAFAETPSTIRRWCECLSSRSWAEISNSFHISWYWTPVITASTVQIWASDLRVKGCSFPSQQSLRFDTTNYSQTVTQSSIKNSGT